MRKLLTLILAFMATTATLFAESGSCGENVNWDLTGGVLTISGTGAMRDYLNYKQPWYSQIESITKVVVEEGVTSIGNTAFRGCAMTSITLPNTLESIGNMAISKCQQLTSVTIPSNVTSIGESAFNLSSGLTEIICEAITPPTCGSVAFGGVTSTIPVYVPAESVSAYKSADGWNYFTNIQAKGAGSKEIYAVANGTKMVLYYDDQKSSRANVIEGWTPKYGTSDMEYEQEIAITLAELDASMQDARPTSTYLWFSRLENMTDIVHLDYLNTSEVTDMSFMFMVCNSLTSLDLHNFNTSSVVDMSGMFDGCESLTSLDVSGFNTSSVVGMSGMFSSCSALTSLDLSGFNTSSVTDMSGMFSDCSSLTSLDVSGFNTSSVMEMSIMFAECSALTSLDLSSFNTDNVTSMNGMFYGCSSLTSLDVSSFNTANVTDMGLMFFECSSLKTIYCDDDWSTSSVLEESDDMFDGCTALVGGKGTKYDAGHVNAAYARPDKGASEPGYFTAKGGISGSCGKNVNWVLKDGVLTISGTGAMTFFANEYEVPWFSLRSSIISVIIEDGVTIIGDCAFKGHTDLTSVTIGNSVSRIRQSAFEGCTGLSAVIIPNSVEYIDSWTFGDCTGLNSVTFGSSVIAIGASAFDGCANLNSLILPASVSSIADFAFSDCSKLANITCKATTPPACGVNVFNNVDNAIPVYVPSEATYAYKLATGWNYFTNIQAMSDEGVTWSLNDGVLTISGTGPMDDYSGKAAIPWYTERNSIVSVIIEDGVTSIGKHAFNECKNIASVQIAQTITGIGNYAFRKCAALTSLTIPAAVKSIGKQAFLDCSGLTEITCEAAIPPTLNDEVFSGVDKSIPVYVPAKSVSAYQAADGWSDFTNIQAIIDASGSCGTNVNWVLSDGVLTISGTGSMANYASPSSRPWHTYAASITTVIVKNGVTTIGESAFDGFTALSAVTLGSTIETIYQYAFISCEALTEITFPNSLSYIGKSAFANSGLTSLTIPEQVTGMGDNAFAYCFGLTGITSEATTPPILGNMVFSMVDNEIPVTVPAGCLKAYQEAEGWNYFINITAVLTPEEQKQVDVVVDLINAIFASGDITLESEPAIVAAREAYNALAPHLQAAVYNYESLVEAEATLAALKANIPIITDGWVHYDNGVFYNSFKIGETETWGIRIPANTVEEKALTKVSMYAYSAGEYTLEVYNGGATPAEGKQLSSQVVNMPTAGDFNIATLANPVPVDPTQDIWVIFKNTAGLKGPMSACAKAGSSNGSWYFDGEGWFTADSYGIAWMIRAFFETYTGEAWIDGINYFLDGSDLTAQVLDLSGDKYVGDIVVPEKATYINDYTVTSINSEAFTNSPELLSVSLPKTVNWIEPGSFLRNPKLTAINVAPANTTYSSLDGVLFNTVQTELIAYPTGRAGAYVVPEGVESILDEAFTDNANLTAITLPASLIEIASLAFEECTGLTSITSKAVNAPAAGSDAFQKVSKSIPVYVPQKGLASYKAEYEWKDFTNFIAIEDKAAADAVIVKIEAIGAVTYTTECKDRIDAARNAYDALTADQKALVPAEKLAILTAAEKAYADLKAQAEADQAAADIVIGQINAIGTVTLSSEPAIVAARQAYDALTDAQKALVTNYAVLTAAEVKLEILKKQAESDAAAAAAVTDLINGIGTVTYTTECKERIDAAREAYNALTDAQKALVTNLGTLTAAEKAYADLKAKAEADQAAADIVIGKINAIGVVSYSEASKALIDDARAAYDALTDAQKGLIPAATYKVLTDAEQAYADLKAKAAADLAAANIVITKIDAIGSVTLSSEPAIVDARAAYNALTTDQKALVTNYATLVAAEKALADLKAKAAADQAAADNVIAEINAIGTVTLSSEPAIVAARAAYNALTADQKALVTNLSTLTAAEVKLAQLKEQAAADQAAADLVIGKINAIGTVSYSEASKALIDAARTAYDALTAAQQALVTNLATLTAAEKAYADLKAKAEADQAAANTVIAQIDAIGEVTLASEPAIVAARAAYNALTADQKALVSNYNVLTAAEAKLEVLKKQAESDEAAAAAVSNLISGIGTVTYTTECKARIDAAREAYDALTDVQKALVTNLATLTAAEKAYADLKAKAEADQAAATAVIGKINAIGEVTLASEPAIVAARSAYNALTADQKALVSNYSVLTAAEAKLEVLKQQAEADQAAATAVIGKINAIGTVAYDEASKARIDDARHAYDALTAAQKALVTNYGVLTAAEQAYADLKAQAEVIAAAKQQLVDLVSEATALKAVAAMYAPAAVGEIEAIIASAQATINDPNATLEEINMKYDNLQYDFELEANKLLEEAKEQLKQSIRALYQPGDYPSWYASAIIPALDQVDAITWDFSMTVQENILLFQATGQTLYNNAKKALEDLRASDTRELVSSCTFTGFADAIQLDMTWNSSALNKLVSDLNASAATEPYHLEADGCMLGKWDPVEEQMVEVMGEKITEGQYQFVAYVTINGEEAKTYRFPKATEAVLTVTVDGTPWTVDLSGITIDANYSYTYIASPLFEISKSEDVELIEIEPVKTQKIYHNGHFYILRGEHIYTIQGTLVK